MNARRVFLLIVLFIVWYLLSTAEVHPALLISVAVVGVISLGITAWLGRRALDRGPSISNTVRVTAAVHEVVLIVLGSAAVSAVRVFQDFRGWFIPVSDWIGLTLVIISALLLIASTANLVASGLGVPIAVYPTRQLASQWLYAWTRNPIVLSAILFLASLAIWMHSAWLLAWTLLLLLPFAVYFLRVFEERELEIRFGEGYREYQERVPMLLPRIPRTISGPRDDESGA